MLVAAVLAACRWLAYQLRFDFDVWPQYQLQLVSQWPWVIALQLVCLLLAGQFSGIYRYFSIPDILRLAYAMLISGAVLYVIRLDDIGFSPPRGVILVQTILGFTALGGMRTAWRVAWCTATTSMPSTCSAVMP